MTDRGMRAIGLVLLGLCAVIAWQLHESAGRIGRNGPTIAELGVTILCFLSFSFGMMTLLHGVALFRSDPTRGRVDNPAKGGQTAPGE